MNEDTGGKHALILSGGGAYGAYEVGVMRALFEGKCASTKFQPLDPDIVAGTSAGAFNAALLLSAGLSDAPAAIQYVQDVYLNDVASGPRNCGNGVLRFRGIPLDVFDGNCYVPNLLQPFVEFGQDAMFLANQIMRRVASLFQSEVDFEQRALELIDLEDYTSVQKYVELVYRRIIPENIRNSGRELQIMATNWKTGELRVFHTEEMDEETGRLAVLASSSIPGVFPSVDIDGQPYADGGLVMNTALRPPVEAGADKLHVIYVDPEARALPLPRLRNTASTVYRMMVIALSAMLDRDIEIAGRINAGIDILQAGARGEIPADPAVRSLQLIIGSLPLHIETGLPYRKLTVHRYHPRGDPGGAFRWLSFGHDHLAELIEHGYNDALQHDCDENQCVLASPSEGVNHA